MYGILVYCLRKYQVSFSDKAEEHLTDYLRTMSSHYRANARTMKLLARAIYQKVILRESASSKVPKEHIVELSDVKMLKWDAKKGKIGF